MSKAVTGFVTALPPSVNAMYVYTNRGPRPSAAMKKFKAEASAEILKQIDFRAEPLEKNVPYKLRLDFFMPALYNKGWPDKAKTRFKRKDVTNLVKIFEDLLCEIYGIDDSVFTEVHLRKFHGPSYETVGISYCMERVERGNGNV